MPVPQQASGGQGGVILNERPVKEVVLKPNDDSYREQEERMVFPGTGREQIFSYNLQQSFTNPEDREVLPIYRYELV